MGMDGSDESKTVCDCSIEIAEGSAFKCKSPECPDTLLCNLCINYHVRRGHPCLESCGHEVPVCADHKMLRLSYCKTCDLVVCFGCYDLHPIHEIESVDKKASFARRQTTTSE